MISVIDTPYQRYVKKVKNDIEGKKSELFELEKKEHEIQRKILRVKSNPSDGKLCRNCHMRLGHTSHCCEYEKCLSVNFYIIFSYIKRCFYLKCVFLMYFLKFI